jgi:hypothetical protein
MSFVTSSLNLALFITRWKETLQGMMQHSLPIEFNYFRCLSSERQSRFEPIRTMNMGDEFIIA